MAAPAAASSKKPNDSPIRVAETPAPENLDGERKTVTALFADIKGSTEMMEDLDPEEARAIIDPALKLMIDAVHRYDGYVVQSTGDGIFALFGAPVAHEDIRSARSMRHCGCRKSCGVFGESGARRGSSDPGAHRHQHWRSRGALDPDRRGSHRIHADRAYDQSRVADAGARAAGSVAISERRVNSSRAISCSSRSARPKSKASASR